MQITAVLCRLFSGHKNEKKKKLTPSRELTAPSENIKQKRRGESESEQNKKTLITTISSDPMNIPMKKRACKK